jgi:uncharacterized membrane protein
MSIRTATLALFGIVLAALGFSLWVGPQLPADVPSHWNAAGQVDGYSSPGMAMFLMPAITLAVGLLLIFLPKIDPLRANVDKFRPLYHWFVIGFGIYFTYIHVLTLLAGLGVVYNMTYALMPAIGILEFGLGFLIERTKQNWFIGIRTPWTLSSPVVWEKTHKLGGLLFKVCGGMALLGIFFRTEIAFIVMLAPTLVATIGIIIYSYVAYRQEQKAR